MNELAETLTANFARVAERIERAARRAGRRAEEVTLVGVSKTFSAEAIRAAHAAGVREFGENRVQEFEKKEPLLKDLTAIWHLVGHLQSNKVARAGKLFQSVDSVDGLAIAERIERSVAGQGNGDEAKRLRVLIEVRLAEEEAKSGVRETEVLGVAEKIFGLPHLQLRGLMCIPPYFDEAEAGRPFFRKLRRLRDDLQKRMGRELPVLSMGMSHDFEVAIEEGATEIRIGTALFGERSIPGESA